MRRVAFVGFGESERAWALRTLNDAERGWARLGYRFEEAPVGRQDIAVLLAPPRVMEQFTGELEGLNVCDSSRSGRTLRGFFPPETVAKLARGPVVFIHKRLWLAPPAHYPARHYRTYVLNHEVGHALGFDHIFSHGRANIMQQQTRTLMGNAPCWDAVCILHPPDE